MDRSKLSGARSIAGAVTGVLLSAIVSPQFQDTTADGVRLKFTITCLVLGVIAIALYALCFAGTKEVVPQGKAKISFRNTFIMLKQNRPLIILCLGALFMLAGMFTMNAVGMYFARYVLGNAGWFTLLMLAQTVAPTSSPRSYHCSPLSLASATATSVWGCSLLWATSSSSSCPVAPSSST